MNLIAEKYILPARVWGSVYDEILIPTDGSEGVKPAVEHAINQAEAHDSRIHILNVMDIRGQYGESPEKSSERLQQRGEEAIEDIVEGAEKRDIRTVSEIRSGIPHKSILKYVENEDIEMIVMGTHGRTGIERTLLGSVTERVVRLSEVPVLTVRRSN